MDKEAQEQQQEQQRQQPEEEEEECSALPHSTAFGHVSAARRLEMIPSSTQAPTGAMIYPFKQHHTPQMVLPVRLACVGWRGGSDETRAIVGISRTI
jgi:hypothetical protein